jgi:hypothetical protein
MSHWSRKTYYVNGWTIEPGIPGPWVIRAYSPIEGQVVRFANALTLRSAKLFAREHGAPSAEVRNAG